MVVLHEYKVKDIKRSLDRSLNCTLENKFCKNIISNKEKRDISDSSDLPKRKLSSRQLIEVLRHLNIQVHRAILDDCEKLLEYCFMSEKNQSNNNKGNIFHVGMENLAAKRINDLCPSIQSIIDYVCSTHFPPKILHGEAWNLNKSIIQINMSKYPLYRSVEKDGSRSLFMVLDMDETLVHCSFEILENGMEPDLLVDIIPFSSPWCVYFRPYLQLFLQYASYLGDLCIFTASTKTYAEKVLKSIDPNGKYIRYKLFREHCTVYKKGYMKDLRIFEGVNMGKTVLIDNSLISSTLQLDNAIPVDSWYGNPNDKELLKLLVLLNKLYCLDDVRPYLARRYGFRQWANYHRAKDSLGPI
ncbi:NLI interacting factor-like phosphatase family protein [Cryptosporidium muris RN66]|uniref:NLI interacting factor-like phosphatase family protein n=1 Tax=Cryptosporidium muris (strain RN66) TaxID=441375 RepID=B6AD77_CRYMR|nr:NLI interacting factor-like phosphatase family protein [Cryptosporidium muris RN66]EEA06081.1 NLI interacting factor-like phosphatase family protein [Cryptosporidium muris RN66]|eukprot:XP_002140430.1 NLI interacting factor-like phosphatase family protein [Cryptosporidium muris RN66]